MKLDQCLVNSRDAKAEDRSATVKRLDPTDTWPSPAAGPRDVDRRRAVRNNLLFVDQRAMGGPTSRCVAVERAEPRCRFASQHRVSPGRKERSRTPLLVAALRFGAGDDEDVTIRPA